MPRRRKTTEEYVKECKQKGFDLPIDNYINNYTKIKHMCRQCGNIYEQAPKPHLQGQGCPACGGNYSYNPKEYYELCKEKGYDLPIESYVNSRTKIKHRCNKGHIYEQSPNTHLHNKGCPKCAGTMKLTMEQYIERCKELGIDLPIKGEKYINNKTKIKHRCANGHIHEQSPNTHLQGQGCPICNESHGEKYIRNYLDKNHIKYIPQKKFHDLKDKTYLSYDYYLPEYNMLIEYQGIQHYESVSFNGKDYTDLEKQQLHDNLKREYAKENGYKLLRPTYKTNTQEKINRYLDRYLVKSLDK